MTEPLLLDHLAAAVPLEILTLEQQGGPSVQHFEDAQKRMAALIKMDEAMEALQYPVAERWLTTRSMAILVECLAVLAFTPGGVKFGKLRFEGKPVYEKES